MEKLCLERRRRGGGGRKGGGARGEKGQKGKGKKKGNNVHFVEKETEAQKTEEASFLEEMIMFDRKI